MKKLFSYIASLAFLAVTIFPTTAKADGPSAVVLYTKPIATMVRPSRTWVRLGIYRVFGNSQPKLVSAVGKVGQYPAAVVVSPDHTTLAINYEHSIVLLNQWTLSSRTVFQTTGTITGMVWSTDGRLFVWLVRDGKRFGYIVDNATGAKQRVYSDSGTTLMTPVASRADGYVILHERVGSKVRGWSLKLSTKSLKRSGFSGTSPVYSVDGKLVAVEDHSITDACSTTGKTTNLFEMKDTVTGQEHGYIGGKTKTTIPLAFSADDQESLFMVMNVSTNCLLTPAQKYVHAIRGSSDTTVMTLTEAQALLQQWQAPSVGAVLTVHTAGRKYRIHWPGRTLAASNQPLTLIGQYWQ